ncbi:tetratricopeptide repeat protein [Methanocella arvoryzae]|uniref:Uncharacterized protein n=1 Tax=Methanocella arvoryzae (strain DSM 22066 / NBRC 105507 / MRE50) TaxID=351160 RepID=Q0W1U4_METAR|nr:tetratricopeptide repeat protein [Methanocella arvoryzae]CAJ37649.1 hypothetical protein RCIX2597 [Methanocella arvoryzae MRE50]
MSRLHEMMDEIERQRRRGNFKGAENLAKLEMKEYELQGNTPYYNFYRGFLWYLYDFPFDAMVHFNNSLLTEDRDMFYVHKFKGVVNLENGKYDEAIEAFEDAMKLVSTEADTISILNSLGNAYLRAGNTQRALELYSEALQLSYDHDLDEWTQITLSNIGVAHVNMGDYKGSLKFFEDALDLARALDDARGERICLNNLAGVLNNMGQREDALELFMEALKKASQIGDKYGMRVAYTNLGYTYRLLDDLDKAMEYYKKALDQAREIGDRPGEAMAQYWINSLREGQKRFVAP